MGTSEADGQSGGPSGGAAAGVCADGRKEQDGISGKGRPAGLVRCFGESLSGNPGACGTSMGSEGERTLARLSEGTF